MSGPFEPMAVARTLFAPAFRLALRLTVLQTDQLPVLGKERREETTVPFTVIRKGRALPDKA